jgi:hypothetical protein
VLKLIYRPITAENDSDEDDEDDEEEEVAEIALAALTPGKVRYLDCLSKIGCFNVLAC